MNLVEFRDIVIHPTFEALAINDPFAETLLMGTGLVESGLNPFPRSKAASYYETKLGFGIYNISQGQHRSVWDEWLAFRPDLASKVRGLASQRGFLSNPDRELVTNLSYATAIAWSIYQQAGVATANTNDIELLWRKYFRGDEPVIDSDRLRGLKTSLNGIKPPKVRVAA